MDEKLKSELANALDVEPAEIMDFRQTEDGSYNVVLFSFQKFTGVEPVEVPLVPEELRKAFNNPITATKTELREVADTLDLEVKEDLKREYVKSITSFKRDRA